MNIQVVRALNFLQRGRDSFQDKWEAVTIPRGTLQVCGFVFCLDKITLVKLFSNVFCNCYLAVMD